MDFRLGNIYHRFLDTRTWNLEHLDAQNTAEIQSGCSNAGLKIGYKLIDSIELIENNALGLDFSMNRLHHMIHLIYLYFKYVFFSVEPHDNPMWDSPNAIVIPFSAGHSQHGDSLAASCLWAMAGHFPSISQHKPQLWPFTSYNWL